MGLAMRRSSERDAFDTEFYPWIPKDHRHPFWFRFWDKVTIGGEIYGEKLTPYEADRLWAERPEDERGECPQWGWIGALSYILTEKQRRIITEQWPRYGRVGVRRKIYSSHRLAWTYFNGKPVPYNHEVRRRDVLPRSEGCQMFLKGPAFEQLCMWPGCMVCEPQKSMPTVEWAYSERVTDEDVKDRVVWRNWEKVYDGWELVDCTEDEPRFLVLEEQT